MENEQPNNDDLGRIISQVTLIQQFVQAPQGQKVAMLNYLKAEGSLLRLVKYLIELGCNPEDLIGKTAETDIAGFFRAQFLPKLDFPSMRVRLVITFDEKEIPAPAERKNLRLYDTDGKLMLEKKPDDLDTDCTCENCQRRRERLKKQKEGPGNRYPDEGPAPGSPHAWVDELIRNISTPPPQND